MLDEISMQGTYWQCARRLQIIHFQVQVHILIEEGSEGHARSVKRRQHLSVRYAVLGFAEACKGTVSYYTRRGCYKMKERHIGSHYRTKIRSKWNWPLPSSFEDGKGRRQLSSSFEEGVVSGNCLYTKIKYTSSSFHICFYFNDYCT